MNHIALKRLLLRLEKLHPKFIDLSLKRLLKLSSEKVFENYHLVGNTVSSSIPTRKLFRLTLTPVIAFTLNHWMKKVF